MDEALKQELAVAADKRLQRLFLQKPKFESLNYRPPTGIGLFDLVYDRPNGVIDVKVKICFKFLNKSDDSKHEYLDWSPSEKLAFKTKSQQVCAKAWSNKYDIACGKPGWNLRSRVNIAIQEVGAGENAHYILEARKVPQTHSSAWSGGCQHGSGTWPYIANFSNWGVETRKDFFGAKLFNFKEKQLSEMLKQMRLECHPGDPNPTSLGNLKKYVDYVNQVLDSDVSGIHCYVYGASATAEGIIFSGPGGKRASAMALELNKNVKVRGFFQGTTASQYKQKAADIIRASGQNPATFEGTCLFIDAPSNSPRSFPTNYIVITHEFGHMLGCPDEYYGVQCTGIKELMTLDDLIPATMSQNLLNKRVTPLKPGQHFTAEKSLDSAPDNVKRQQQQHKAFAAQVQQAGVTSPYFMDQASAINDPEVQESTRKWYAERDRIKEAHGRDSSQYKKFAATTWLPVKQGITDSIMFSGQKILPAHYLPIWSCLGSLTREYLDPSDWTITPAM